MILFLIMYQFALSLSYLCDSSQQSTILPLDKPYTQQQQIVAGPGNLGLGIWFKWQPLAPISILYAADSCQDQFIYMLEQTAESGTLTQIPYKFIILYLETGSSYSLKIKSNFLALEDKFPLGENADGTWMFFYIFIDYSNGQTKYTFYNTMLLEFSVKQTQSLVGKINLTIGGACNYCIPSDGSICSQQFKGRISSVSQGDEALLIENLIISIDKCFSFVNDCQYQGETLLVEKENLIKDQFLNFETQVMEKQIYQFSGWFILNYVELQNREILIFKITNYYNENPLNAIESIQLKYVFTNAQKANLNLHSISLRNPLVQEQPNEVIENDQFYTMFQSWHYIQFDIISDNQAELQIFSLILENPIIVKINTGQYSGERNYLFIGGALFSPNNFVGSVANVFYQSFCQFEQYSFKPRCHYTCETCFGPYSDNCLTCGFNTKRILSNHQCFCQQQAIDYKNESNCKLIQDIFGMIIETEKDLGQNSESYDYYDEKGNIACTFGYFTYNNQCIKCPYSYLSDQDTIIKCFDCIGYPKEFQLKLTCSIDAVQYLNDKKNVFEMIQREETDIEYFEIIETSNKQYDVKLTIGQINKARMQCRRGYYKIKNDCFSCSFACLECDNYEKCNQCLQGYFINQQSNCEICPNNCEKCQLENQHINCQICSDKHYLDEQKQCLQCGQFCASCRSNGFCNYCEDPQQYFVSLDGKNCQICDIQNCKFCYQVGFYQNKIFTSFDLLLENYIEEYKHSTIEKHCARCLSGYAIDSKTQSCVKVDQIAPLCLYGTSDDSGTLNCIAEEGSCATFVNCLTCNQFNCYQCKSGYYPDILTNRCLLCPKYCLNCLQQNKMSKDFWKWEIQQYYMSQYNGFNHKFSEFSFSKNRNDLEVICISCFEGYILYQQSCIEECQKGCDECKIIGFMQTCIKCSQQVYGIPKSATENSICQECPNNCAACLPRSYDDIQAINNNFIITQDNQKYTKLCYYMNENLSKEEHFYMNQNFIVECKSFQKCKQEITFEWNLYCDQSDYDSLPKTTQDFRANYLIQEFFDNQVLKQIEISGFINYLNDKGFSTININLNIVQGVATICNLIPNNLQTKLYSKIFFLQNLNLKIFSLSKSLLSDAAFYFTGFSSITFENLIFRSFIAQVSESQIRQINFFGCDVVKSPVQKNQKFFVASQHIYNLSIVNFQVQNVNYINQFMFQFSFDLYSVGISNIVIDNLKFLESNLLNSTIVYIKIIEQFQQVNVRMTNVDIINAEIEQSNLIISDGGKNIFVGTMQFENFKVSSVQLLNSILFYLPNVLETTFNLISISNIDLFEMSYFLLGNSFNCNHFIIENVYLSESFLISNKVELFFQINKQSVTDISLSYFSIKGLKHTHSQSILQLIKYDSCDIQLNIKIFSMVEAEYRTIENLGIQSQESALIFVYCLICQLDQVYIERYDELPEISILGSSQIKITNSIFTQHKQYQGRIIYPTFECLYHIFKLNKYYFLFIGDYQQISIDNLQILNAVSYYQPFIVIQGLDIMKNQITENIKITNSIFKNNILTIINSNQATSIIQIISEQKSIVVIQNTQFINNHMNAYIQDLTVINSATIVLQMKLSAIQLQNCYFANNIITNSTNSILYLKGNDVHILNTNFYQNNFLNFSNLMEKIILESGNKIIETESLRQIFQINSNGGNGYILANNVHISNSVVKQSNSLQGGGFYINTFGNSQIIVEDSIFQQTQTSFLSTSNSVGGCFYIDSQISKLTLIIRNTTFNTSFSRMKGGALYILPSNSWNDLQFEQVTVINCFSISSSFLDFNSKNSKASIHLQFNSFIIQQQSRGFDIFLSQLEYFTNNEANYLYNSNPMFYIGAGNVTFSKFKLSSDVGLFLAKLEGGSNINFFDITFSNGLIFSTPLIQMNLQSGVQGKIVLNNLQISKLLEYENQKKIEVCKETKSQKIIDYNCLNPNFNTKQNILVDNSLEKLQNQNICNNIILFSTGKQNYSLIQITDVEQVHYIWINKLKIQQTTCKNCQFGLLNLLNIQQHLITNIELTEISLINCRCSLTSCFTIINDQNFDSFKTDLLNKNRLMQQQDYQFIMQSTKLQVVLQDSFFHSNNAIYGGGICIIGIDILIKNSYFLENQAQLGGAIYYQKNQTQVLLLLQTILRSNSAQTAGGIFLFDQFLQETKNLDVILIDNNSTVSESDILEKPRSLALSIDGGQTVLLKKTIFKTQKSIIEQAIIQPYKILGYKQKVTTLTVPSGQAIGNYSYFDLYSSQNIKYNLTFRILALNKLRKRETNLEGSKCTLTYKIINLTNEEVITSISATISQKEVNFSSETKDFNLDNLIIQFDPYIEKEIVLRIFIKCNCIEIPVFDQNPPFSIISKFTDYQLFVDIRTFPCQLGEYFNQEGACIQCDSEQSQYQVQLNASNCQFKDDYKINSVKSQIIELKQSFWRPYFYSTTVEECYHLFENCLGGWEPGDKSCSEGHIGALCEQCDLYDVRGNGNFATSQPYKCGNCAQISGNVISIIFISIWTVVSVLMSVSSTLETIREFLTGSYLSIFGISYVNKKSSTAVLIKVFTNYLQIIQTISTFQLKVPQGLASSFNGAGNPIQQMSYSLDCFLISLSDITIIYFRIIWSLTMAAFYISIFFIILSGAILLNKVEFNISMVTTALIYIFIFLQPSIVQALISLASFRVISDIAWIQGNVSFRYDSFQHKIWLLSFCLPLLFLFCILIPLLMYIGLRKQKDKLDTLQTRETWGYLYNEYKLHAYYWEFVKILLKELIIIILSYYEDHIAIKASLVFLFIFAYSYLTMSESPYMTMICAVSIILGSSIYTAQNSNLVEIVYPFYFMIAVLNAFLIVKVIVKIFFAYMDNLHEQIDRVKGIILTRFSEKLVNYPGLLKLLESQKVKDERIKKNFGKIKSYLFSKARQNLKLRNTINVEPKSKSTSDKSVQSNLNTNTSNQKYPKPQQIKPLPKILQDSKDLEKQESNL